MSTNNFQKSINVPDFNIPTFLDSIEFGRGTLMPGRISYAANHTMIFQVNNSEKMKILPAGHVFIEDYLGIGTSAPNQELDIESEQAVAQLLSTNGANGSVLELRNSTSSPNFLGAINFGTANTTPGQISYSGDNEMTFRVNNADRITISAAGLIGIGRVATTNRLEVEGNASKSSAGDWLANSDERLKKNIQQLDSKVMLDKLLSLRGVTYEWNDDKTGADRPEGIQYGFSAQNIQEAFPTLVEQDAKGYLQTAYGTFDAMTVEAIRALQDQISRQENYIQALEQQQETILKELMVMKQMMVAASNVKP